MLMEGLSLLSPLRRRNIAVWIHFCLLLCHGKNPKSTLLITAVFVDWNTSLLNVMFWWLNFAVDIFCLMSILFVICAGASCYNYWDPSGLAIDCSGGLSTQLGNLFEDMKFSDVIFNIGGRRFPAHKIILSARSEVFEAMFEHSTQEKFTNQIEIEEIEPEVFQELLRFIYTGRLDSKTMKTMAARLLIAADEYVLNELKSECQNYLYREMSPVNCVEIILHGDLLNPAKYMKNVLNEAAVFFRYLPDKVMATAKWEKMEKENPQILLKVQKILFSGKV
jgi:speckle-type POZ protein